MNTGADLVRPADVVLCPGTNCLELTGPVGLCPACWAFRLVLHQRITVGWHAAFGYLAPSQLADEHVSGGAGPGSRPAMDLTVFSAIEATLAVVVGWASRIRERVGKSALPGLSMARTSWLFDHAMPDLAQHDHELDADEQVEYYADLYRCYRQLRLIGHDAVRESEHLSIPCPSCGRMTIINRQYGDSVACLTCSREWGQAAWYAQLNAVRATA